MKTENEIKEELEYLNNQRNWLQNKDGDMYDQSRNQIRNEIDRLNNEGAQ